LGSSVFTRWKTKSVKRRLFELRSGSRSIFFQLAHDFMHAGEVFTEHINGLIVTTPFDADKLRRQGHDVNLSKLSQVDPWPRKPLRRTEGPKNLKR
jgi:hypothetical protein